MFISALENPNFVIFWANCFLSSRFCLFVRIMSNEECVSNAYILFKWYGIFQPIFVSVYVAMQNWKIFSDKKYHTTPVDALEQTKQMSICLFYILNQTHTWNSNALSSNLSWNWQNIFPGFRAMDFVSSLHFDFLSLRFGSNLSGEYMRETNE